MRKPPLNPPRAGRPPMDPARRRQSLSLRLPPAQIRWLREHARERGLTISRLMQDIVCCEMSRASRLAPAPASAADVIERLKRSTAG